MSHLKIYQRITFFILFVFALPAFAASNTPAPALSGYDVVSYFTKNKAEKGTPQYTHKHKGKTYQFTSNKQRNMFAAAPDKYLPQYGGSCAFGMTFGETLDASPKAWKIVNNKLYFNLDKSFMKKWARNVAESIRQADEHWELINSK